MIRGFWPSRLLSAGIFLAACATAVAAAVRDVQRGLPAYIPVLAVVLLLALGVVAGRLAGNILANQLNTKALALLHVQLDPEAFLARYAPVPGRLRQGSRSHAVACAYLADGYAAAGRYDEALAALAPPPAGDLALQGLYHSKRAACLLGKEDAPAAAEALDALEQVVEASRAEKPALADNLGETLRLYRSWLACLSGGRAEGEWLANELPKAPYQLRRLELLKVLALYELSRQRLGKARGHLEELQRTGGKTCFVPWAAAALANLPARE